MEKRNILIRIYDKHYKKLMLIPVLMLVFAIVVIGMNIAKTGDFINKGVSLKGGASITVFLDHPVNVDEVQQKLQKAYPKNDITVRSLERAGKQIGIEVAADIEGTDSKAVDQLINTLSEAINQKLTYEDYNVQVIGSSLGQSFFKQIFKSLIMAFIFMAAVVWYYFRIPVPSFFVVLAVLSDVLVTIAIIDLLGIKVSTAGIAALLMLIGYSVDTDILLSTRVLKQNPKTVFDGILSALKTGLTMSATTTVAVTAAILLTESAVLKQIMLIILIGLLVDVINTWLQNAALLRWYLERKGRV